MHPRYRKNLVIIVIIGLFIRVLFTLFGAELYYGTSNFYSKGDTEKYTIAAKGLVNQESNIIDFDNQEYSVYNSSVYSMFVSVFYLVSGRNIDITYQLILWMQVLLDSLTIVLLFSISRRIFRSQRVGLVVAGLYALYPFIVAWVPMITGEMLSILLLIYGLYLFTLNSKRRYLISGIVLGAAILCRNQIVWIVPILLTYLVIVNTKAAKKNWQSILLLVLGLSFVYVPWSIYKYSETKRLDLTMGLKANNEEIGKDILAFRNYMNTVQTDFEPQFTQLITGEEVTWPEGCYLNREDSIKLRRVEYLTKNCGSGFSNYSNYWNYDNYRMDESLSCNDEIVSLYDELRQNQIASKPFNYKIVIPLNNLKKAFFKSSLHNAPNPVVKIVSLILFIFRSMLLILGLVGIIFMIRKRNVYWIIIVSFLFILYFYFSFVVRNVEMRYLLPADILMLIPAGYIITIAYKWFAIKQHKRKPENFRI